MKNLIRIIHPGEENLFARLEAFLQREKLPVDKLDLGFTGTDQRLKIRDLEVTRYKTQPLWDEEHTAHHLATNLSYREKEILLAAMQAFYSIRHPNHLADKEASQEEVYKLCTYWKGEVFKNCNTECMVFTPVTRALNYIALDILAGISTGYIESKWLNCPAQLILGSIQYAEIRGLQEKFK